MKKLLLLLTMTLFCSTIWAQTPDKMSYQAVVRNSNNVLVVNSMVGMKISVLQGTPDGGVTYSETQGPTTNDNGLFSIEIGSGNAVTGDFSTINWSEGPYFIKTEIDPDGGSNYSITGISQLLSVPYALHAKSADHFTGTLDESDPTFNSSVASEINTTDIENWNNHFSGDYSDLMNLPDIQDSILIYGYDGQYNSLSGAPENIGDFYNDVGYLTEIEEVDPSFNSSPAGTITVGDMEFWNNQFSGDYSDLTNQPNFQDSISNYRFDGQYSSLSGAPQNVSSFSNDAGYLTSFNEEDGSTTNEIQNVEQVLNEGNDANGQDLVNVGQVTIGSATATDGAALEVNSSDGAFLLPRMTTTERNALPAAPGMMIYNTETGKFQGYSGTSSSSIVAGSSVGLTYAYVLNDGYSQDHPAQSFQVQSNVNLESISFWVHSFFNSFSSGTITFNVFQGLPNSPGQLLYTQNVTVDQLGQLTIEVSSSPELTAGTNYYFELVPQAQPDGWFSVSRSNGATEGEHQEGTLWYYYGDEYMEDTYNPSSVDDLKFEVNGITDTFQWNDLD